MSGISSTYLLQRSDDGTLSLVLCVRHAEGGVSQCFALQNTDRRVAHSSPTRRDDFVRGDSSGARPERILGDSGRGLYAGANVGGLYAEYSQNGGWNYGGTAFKYEMGNDYSKISLFGLYNYQEWDNGDYKWSLLGLLGNRNSLLAADGFFGDSEMEKRMDLLYTDNIQNREGAFTFIGHGNSQEIYDDSYDSMTPEEFAGELKQGGFGYKGQKLIRLYSCSTGKGEHSFAARLAKLMNVTVIAPTTDLDYEVKNYGNKYWGTVKFHEKEGYWHVFKPN